MTLPNQDNDLDKKLNSIAENHFGVLGGSGHEYMASFISQIKQAFTDAGYITPSVMDLRMTGEQWYNRLKQEFVSPTNVGTYYVGDLLMIARRASGMEQHSDA